jgi:hypothetical protein
MKKSAMALTILLAGISQWAGAHPGHGAVFAHGDGAPHPILSGEHVLLLGAIGIAVLLLRRIGAGINRRNKEQGR